MSEATLKNASGEVKFPYKMSTKEEVINGPINSTHWVTLADLTVIPEKNTRGKTTYENVLNKQVGLGDNMNSQQIQEIAATLHDLGNGNKAILVYVGYTRVEAMTRNAIQDVVVQWNEEMKLSPGDELYVDPTFSGMGFEAHLERKKIYSHSKEWADRYRAALAKYPVRINVGEYDEKETYVRGVAENLLRDNVSLLSRINQITIMVHQFKMKRKEISEQTGLSDASISQYLSAGSIKENMTKLFVREFGPINKLSEENQPKWDKLNVAFAELERRMEVMNEYSLNLNCCTALNAFLNRAVKSETKYRWKNIFEAFGSLICLDENGDPKKTQIPLASSTFKHGLTIHEARALKKKEDKVNDEVDSVNLTDLNLSIEQDEEIKVDDVNESGEDAESIDVSGLEVESLESDEDSPVQDNNESKDEVIVETTEAEQDVKIDDFTISIDDTEDSDDEDEEPTDEDIAGIEGDDLNLDMGEGEEEEEYTGEKASKTVEPAGSKEVKDMATRDAIVESIKIQKLMYETSTGDDDSDPLDTVPASLIMLGEISQSYNVLKKNEEATEISAAANDLAESLSELLKVLNTHAKATMNQTKYGNSVEPLLSKIKPVEIK